MDRVHFAGVLAKSKLKPPVVLSYALEVAATLVLQTQC
jgi:hypothetical protein